MIWVRKENTVNGVYLTIRNTVNRPNDNWSEDNNIWGSLEKLGVSLPEDTENTGDYDVLVNIVGNLCK